ncbi:hypothetical protein PENSPDRAFT_695546, partial [Peniophora sp. CONT]
MDDKKNDDAKEIKKTKERPFMKAPLLFTAEETLKEGIKAYAKGIVELAESAMRTVQQNSSLVDGAEIVWPTVTIERATYLWRLLTVGVPSINAFKRAFTSLRRATLELEGFHIWAMVMQSSPAEMMELAASLKSQKGCIYRGAFLNGSRREWLDEGSEVRRIYARISRWNVPVYALVHQLDWDLEPLEGLRVERESQQLPFYCYPPEVSGVQFERASRGLSAHPLEGQPSAVEDLAARQARRLKTQLQQLNSQFPDMWKKAVGENKRPHPEVQARTNWKNKNLNPTAPSLPAFMTFWPPSDVFSTHPPTLLKADIGTGTFLPRPTTIWGVNEDRKLKMLETLVSIWKLLVLRPCLFRNGELSAKQAYLGAQSWCDILNLATSDTVLSAMWQDGKPELWGTRLLPSVLERTRTMSGQPTLKRMDCGFGCIPNGKFLIQNDPQHHLQHFVLFRLVELHVLHDFASYHPSLQLSVDGRWCPPPFDAQEALDDRPNAFLGMTVAVSVAEREAMDEILTIVRWNGADGQRAWEMPDGESYRNWLTAFRALLNNIPGAWVENPVLAGMPSGLNVLT